MLNTGNILSSIVVALACVSGAYLQGVNDFLALFLHYAFSGFICLAILSVNAILHEHKSREDAESVEPSRTPRL